MRHGYVRRILKWYIYNWTYKDCSCMFIVQYEMMQRVFPESNGVLLHVVWINTRSHDPMGALMIYFIFLWQNAKRKSKLNNDNAGDRRPLHLHFFFVFEFLFETCHSQSDVASELFLPGIWFIVSMRNNKIDLIFHFEKRILSFWFRLFRFTYRSTLSDAFQPPLSQSHTFTSHNNIAVSLVSMHSV